MMPMIKLPERFEVAMDKLHYIHYREYMRKKRQLKRLKKQLRKRYTPNKAEIMERISDIEEWIVNVYEARKLNLGMR